MYDQQDYIEEFQELTTMGMSCREIVTRCKPSQQWFRNNVFPHVHRAVCITCHRTFDPATIERGTECSVICRNTYTGFGKPQSQNQSHLYAYDRKRRGLEPANTGLFDFI